MRINELHQKEQVALTRLIRLLNSGTEFYRLAEDAICDDYLATFFDSMAFAREASLAELQPFVTRATGHIEAGHANDIELRKKFANLIADLTHEPENVYIEELEEIEDRTLEAIDSACQEAVNPDLTVTLTEVRQRMTVCREKMHQLHLRPQHRTHRHGDEQRSTS